MLLVLLHKLLLKHKQTHLQVYKLHPIQVQQVVERLPHTILELLVVLQVAVVAVVAVVLLAVLQVAVAAVVLLAVVVQDLQDLQDLLVADTAADTKKPYRQKNTPNFLSGYFGFKGHFWFGGLYSNRVLQV